VPAPGVLERVVAAEALTPAAPASKATLAIASRCVLFPLGMNLRIERTVVTASRFSTSGKPSESRTAKA